MTLTLDNAGALVPGVTVKEDSVKMQKVKILSSFSDGKKSLEKNSIQILPMWLAVQAKDANKVLFLADDEPTKIESKAEVKEVGNEIPAETKFEEKGDLKETVDKQNIGHLKKK